MTNTLFFRYKKLLIGASLLIAFTILLIMPKTFAATITWSGDGDGTNFSDGDNWVGGVAPVDGDDIVFPADLIDSNTYPVNIDIEDLVLAGLTIGGECIADTSSVLSISSSSYFILSGDIDVSFVRPEGQYCSVPIRFDSTSVIFGADIEVVGSAAGSVGFNDSSLNFASFSLTSSRYIDFTYTSFIGSGNIDFIGGFAIFSTPSSTFDGSVSLEDGSYSIAGAWPFGTSSVIVGDGAELLIGSIQEQTITSDITFSGTGPMPLNRKIGIWYCAGEHTVTFSGTVTLLADAIFSGSCQSTFVIESIARNGFNLINADGSQATLIIEGEKEVADQLVVTIDDIANCNNTWNATNSNAKVIVNVDCSEVVGIYPDAPLSIRGVLAGTGKVGHVEILDGGIISPGLSPGCLATNNLEFEEGGTYEFEIGGTTACSGYDQIDVTGSVTLGSGTLDITLLDSYSPSAGDSFVIIKNDGSDAVNGTFANLAEGATTIVGGTVFQISYQGGSGNDVVLTVQSVPEVPDTGFALLLANPLTALFSSIISAGGILAIARRQF
jgi:hypothetical protein